MLFLLCTGIESNVFCSAAVNENGVIDREARTISYRHNQPSPCQEQAFQMTAYLDENWNMVNGIAFRESDLSLVTFSANRL